jgi:hypothetical protein
MEDKDNFLNDEWGNIGPDSIHDPKWNVKRSSATIKSQRKKMLKNYADKEYKKEWLKANVERWNDEEWAKQQRIKMEAGMDKEYHRNMLKDPEWQQKYGASARWKDPAFKKMMLKINKERKRTPLENRQNAIRNGGLPFKSPYGYFSNPKQASEYITNKLGIPISQKVIRIRLKGKSRYGHEGFEYVSWAEYDKVMGITGLPQE